MSHRRSARIQGSSKRPNYDVDNDTSSDESFEERPKAPRKKRVKNAELPVDRLSAKRRVRTTKSGAAMSTSTGAAQTSATQRRKAQKLGMVLNMPLDILFEIFGYLQPLDLLRLSRLTQPLRKLLLARSARSVWMEALDRVPNLPPCPQFLQEPQYASLCFESNCHFCGTTHILDVLWVHRVRTCKKCMSIEDNERHFEQYRWESHNYPDQFPAYPLVPWSHGVSTHRYNKFTLKQPYDAVSAKLTELGEDPDALDAYTKERKQIVEEYNEFANRCSEWYNKIRDEHYNELDAIRKQRRDAIEARLRDLGWSKELSWLRSGASWHVYREYKFHKLVNQPRLLTERIWANIQTALLEFLQPIRSEREAEVWKKAVAKRCDLLQGLLDGYARERPVSEPQPRISDLVDRIELLRAVLDTELDDDEEDPVTVDEFADVMTAVPAAAEIWRVDCRLAAVSALPNVSPSSVAGSSTARILSAKIEEHVDDDHTSELSDHTNSINNAKQQTEGYPVENEPTLSSDVAATRLALATSLFHCAICKNFRPQVLHASNIFAHTCFWSSPPANHPYRAQHEVIGKGPWSHGRVVSHKDAVEITTRLIELCGLNPHTATVDDMDRCDARFACPGCVECPPTSGVRGMTWRRALVHSVPRPKPLGTRFSTFVPRPSLQPRLLSDEDAAEVRRIEASPEASMQGLAQNNHTRSYSLFTCIRCRQGRIPPAIMGEHLSRCHDIERPVEKDDFVLSQDVFAPVEIPIFIHVPIQDAPQV